MLRSAALARDKTGLVDPLLFRTRNTLLAKTQTIYANFIGPTLGLLVFSNNTWLIAIVLGGQYS